MLWPLFQAKKFRVRVASRQGYITGKKKRRNKEQ